MSSKLELVIVTQDGKPSPIAVAITFDEQGGTIGRAPGSTMVLDAKQVHRKHAKIILREDDFYIRNEGTQVVRVNDIEISNSDEYQLADQCLISIGPYILRAHVRKPAGIHSTEEWRIPDDTLIRRAKEIIHGATVGVHEPVREYQPVADWRGGSRLDDRDGATVKRYDADKSPDHPNIAQDYPGETLAHDNTDSEEALPEDDVPARATEPEWRDPGPDSSDSSLDTSAQRAWHALLKGARIENPQHRLSHPASQSDLEAQMQYLGGLLYACVDGYKELAQARAQVRYDLLDEAPTQLRLTPTGDENPIKRITRTGNVVAAMISKPEPDVMDGVHAIGDLVGDLLAHLHATSMGISQAPEGIFEVIKPERFHATDDGGGFLSGLMPQKQKARLWDQFVASCTTLAESGVDDFRIRFVEVYRKAHEDYLAKLRAR